MCQLSAMVIWLEVRTLPCLTLDIHLFHTDNVKYIIQTLGASVMRNIHTLTTNYVCEREAIHVQAVKTHNSCPNVPMQSKFDR